MDLLFFIVILRGSIIDGWLYRLGRENSSRAQMKDASGHRHVVCTIQVCTDTKYGYMFDTTSIPPYILAYCIARCVIYMYVLYFVCIVLSTGGERCPFLAMILPDGT